MAQDLRSYLDLVKRRRPDELVVVSKEIDPVHEITALVVKLEREQRRRPVLLLEKVKGTAFPVLTNLHASRARLAMAINAEPAGMLRAYLKALERPIPPRVVATGPVKEVVLTGDRIDLRDLPQIIHHEGDAGVFLTAAISFAKDPTAETWNCAYNRLMLKGRDTTSIHLTLGKHLWEFHRLAEQRNEPLPVAFAIGVHPAIALGALAIGSVDEDERAIMGALLGDHVVHAEVGDLVFKPRDQWHTFWNAGDEPCRVLEIISPGGFEGLFRELGAKLAGGDIDPAELPAFFSHLSETYGIEFDPEATPAIAEEHGLWHPVFRPKP